jgi:hypothetical protein
VTLSATHTDADVDRLLEALAELDKEVIRAVGGVATVAT